MMLLSAISLLQAVDVSDEVAKNTRLTAWAFFVNSGTGSSFLLFCNRALSLLARGRQTAGASGFTPTPICFGSPVRKAPQSWERLLTNVLG